MRLRARRVEVLSRRREPKVAELGHLTAIIQKDILWLDVTVEDGACVEVAKRGDELERPSRYHLRLELCLRPPRGCDLLPQVTRIAKLHHEADDNVLVAVRVEEKVVVGDDAVVVTAQ